MNILLVEDNPGDIMLAKEALREGAKMEHLLNVVTDGEAALKYLFKEGEYADAKRPDLVLLDLNIPRKSGKEVLKAIKQHPSLKTIPVIVFSTSNAEYDINTSYSLHANCYVTKPVDYDDFVKVMTSIVNFWMRVSRTSPIAA